MDLKNTAGMSKNKILGDFFAVSQMLVKFAEDNEDLGSSSSGMSGLESGKGLIIPNNGDAPQIVQRDGPKGKRSTRAAPPVMSLRMLDGELYVFDHGKMVQKGSFEYQHITSDLMTSLLQIGQDVPALAPDLPDQPDAPGTKLTAQKKKSTPTSETVLLQSVQFGETLALEYSDDPKDTHARLVSLPEAELLSTMKKIEQKKDMIFKVNPVIKIRTADNPISDSENNTALYFVTTKYYYYIHVDADMNPPKLDLERVNMTKEFDPHHDFIRHLQFTEKPASSHSEEDTDGDTLDSIPEKEEDSNGSDPSESEEHIPEFQDLATLDRSQSEGSSSSKPNSLDLRILSDPSIFRKMADVSIDSANGEDGVVIEKQTTNAESKDNDVDHHSGVPTTVGTGNNTGLCSNTEANIE